MRVLVDNYGDVRIFKDRYAREVIELKHNREDNSNSKSTRIQNQLTLKL